MNALPVIAREMREESRNRRTRWMRLSAVVVMSVLFLAAMLDQQASSSILGARLFRTLNLTLFLSIWLLVPVLASDCISRERREATLGLLFLTPLTPLGIIVGKVLVHGLRSISLLLAVLPILIIPFLLGGVTWQSAVLATLVNVSSVIIALGAGVLASTYFRSANRAAVASIFIGQVLYILFATAYVATGVAVMRAGSGVETTLSHLVGYFGTLLIDFLNDGIRSYVNLVMACTTFTFGSNYQAMDFYYGYLTKMGVQPGTGMAGVKMLSGVLSVVMACLFFGFALLMASLRIRSNWKDQPPTKVQIHATRIFLTPRFWKGVFKASMSRLLDRNPVGWLHNYSTFARLSKWGWCLIIIFVECFIAMNPDPGILQFGQLLLGALVLLAIAFASSNSFRAEKESGAFELLLVTPLRERQLLFGRVCGIWYQFLPAIAVLTLAWWVLSPISEVFTRRATTHGASSMVAPLMFACLFLTLPSIGLFFSMRRWSPIGAWIATSACGLLFPLLVYLFMVRFRYSAYPSNVGYSSSSTIVECGVAVVFVQSMVALAAAKALHANLISRKFVQRTS